MCGRFTQTHSQQAILNRFLVKIMDEEIERLSRPRYNIAPTQQVPVVMNTKADGGARELRAMRWGLIPNWAKEPQMKLNTINARVEGVEGSPVYRQALHRTRCIVPASGYYEWKAGTSPKQPYYIYPSERGDLFAMAGLWDRWTAPDGSSIDSFTILTTQANSAISPVHHRMPVLLREEEISLWLGESLVPVETLRTLMKPCDPDLVQMHAVSPIVNKVSHDSEKNLEPYELMQWDF